MPADMPERATAHERVLESLQWIEPKSDLIAQTFYQRLLTKHPELAALFAGTDMPHLGQQLMATFSWAVRHWGETSKLQERLKVVGARHKLRGVSLEHFDLVGECFLGALESELGEAFTDELRHAWVQAYLMVVSSMQDAYYTSG